MDVFENADRLAQLIEEKLGVRGAGLEAKLTRAGRNLPKHIRADALMLVNAMTYEGHPKLSRQLDYDRLDRAFANAEHYLVNVDTGARQRGLALDWLAKTAFNLILLAVLLMALLRWRGFV